MLGLDLQTLLIRVITLMIAFTVHELSHAASATYFGDNTARAAGRLTLDPLRHLDPLGSLLLIFSGFGWAKPVPVNPYQLRRPSDMMWVSLAGPFSNFLLALVAVIPLRLKIVPTGLVGSSGLPTVYEFLFTFIIINLSLMLFNLLPIAPLDGEKIALFAWPPSWQRVMERISPYGPYVLLLIVFAGPLLRIDLLGAVINPVLLNLMSLFMGGSLVVGG